MESTWQAQLGQLYREHQRGLYALALSVTRQRDLAEDAVHEAFTRMCKRAKGTEGLEKECDRVAYAYRSVKNAAVDQWRRQKSQRALHAGLAAQPPLFAQAAARAWDGASGLEANERKAVLSQAIERLPEADQQTVLLRIYGNLSIDQIAVALEQSRTTVSSRYHRALKKLNGLLSESMGAETGVGYA